MRVVFMGTPAFAVPSLEALAATHVVAAVYTAPDRPAGRGLKVRETAVGEAARRLGIPVEQPESLRDTAIVEHLSEYRPDVIAVAAYGLLLPTSVLDLPRFGCVNVHPSILPRHRGAAPIERAILEGDTETGVCIMRMDAGLDTGPVASCTRLQVATADAAALSEELARIGASDLLAVVDRLEADDVHWTAQAADGVTYAAKMTAADVALAPGLSAAEAVRRVRASSRTASARAVIDGRPVVVLEATEAPSTGAPGSMNLEGGLVLGLADGAIRVERLVPAGRRAMTAAEFVRGARLDAAASWSAAE